MESSNPTTASPQAGDLAPARRHRFGIQNGLIYWGIVVLMASLLLWVGVELAKRVEWFLPYSGGLGLSLIAGGYLLELRKARKARASQRSQPEQPGGFDVGSELTWQAFPFFNWQLTKCASLELGYRLLYTDYEAGSGLNRFKYDMLTSGPQVEFTLHF
jgi:hypothetical protein